MRQQQILKRDAAPETDPAQAPACPRCGATLTFSRSDTALIDSCGFESYRLECEQCGAHLAGIVDPADDALLLSQLAD
jgi:hypothetical protein